jgi:hypothetical protein
LQQFGVPVINPNDQKDEEDEEQEKIQHAISFFSYVVYFGHGFSLFVIILVVDGRKDENYF